MTLMQQYRSLVDNINDLLFSIDSKGRILFCNNFVEKIIGYKPHEVMAKKIEEFIHPEDFQRIFSSIQDLIQGRKNDQTEGVDIEFRLKHKTGDFLGVSARTTPVKNANEEVTKFIGVVRKISDRRLTEEALQESKEKYQTILENSVTERKQAERKLRESEEKYRTILKNIEDGYYEVDLTGNLTFFNESMCKILGYSKDEMLGLNYKHYTNDVTAKTVYKAFNKVYRTGVPTKIVDYEIIRKDKINTVNETSVSLITDSSGESVGFRGIVRDVTERKQAERKLRESEEKYRTILKNIEDGYYEVDLTGNLTFFNESMCKILGYSKDKMIGMNYRKYLDESTAKIVYKTFNEVYRTRKSAKAFDWSIRTRKGNRKFIEASISLIVDSTDKSVGFRGICRDITKRKQIEKMKDDLERRRADFISMTSHELRTPLTVIKWYESFLEKHFFSLSQDKMENHFKLINRNISRLERLISGVSDIGKIERGIFETEPKKTNLSKFLNEAMQPYIELLGSQFQYHKIPEEFPCDVNIDESRLIQVLGNIIENAIKHTDTNQRKISVMPEIFPDIVRITVSDNGAGIKSENLKELFEPFTSFPTEYSVKGTGIGLFVVRVIIESHSGTITAQSEGEGMGSAFIICLPRITVDEI